MLGAMRWREKLDSKKLHSKADRQMMGGESEASSCYLSEQKWGSSRAKKKLCVVLSVADLMTDYE